MMFKIGDRVKRLDGRTAIITKTHQKWGVELQEIYLCLHDNGDQCWTYASNLKLIEAQPVKVIPLPLPG
jgi:hypothetical protein